MNKFEAILTGSLSTGLASTSGAATVQITLGGNMISNLGGNQLVADLTGDSIDDLTFGAAIITLN